MLNVSVIIPFYNLSHREGFVKLLNALLKSEISSVIVVDDGSAGIYDDLFIFFSNHPKLTVLKHAVNSGKGASIKTALNYVYFRYPEQLGVVVMHANGQHRWEDALNLAHELERFPDCIIQGIKRYAGDQSFSAKMWNGVLGFLFGVFTGSDLRDVTTGMRAIPRSFIPRCLKIRSNYYEFDMDLILLCKYNNVCIRRLPIDMGSDVALRSRFNPVVDSMKIFFVFFRFLLVSLWTALIDFLVFMLVYSFSSKVILSIALSRILAMTVNYRLIKSRVFYSTEKDYLVLGKYLLLVFLLGGISCSAIMALMHGFGTNVFVAKASVEMFLFILNFLVQRDFIFVSDNRYEKTNWDQYYLKPYASAKMTRKIMEQRLIANMKTFIKDEIKIMEVGGANSCFLEGILKEVRPKEYYVVDNNETGLIKLRQRKSLSASVYLYNRDILKLEMADSVDLCFSVGLIEHFPLEKTKAAIKAHFDTVKSGGIVLLTFPTSTWLYHLTRFWSVLMGLWIFNDERPLRVEDVISLTDQYGEILHHEIVWPIFLTQAIVVARKY